jgi:hypothetical protein
MIRWPEKELSAWRPYAAIGTMPPAAPTIRRHSGVWRPYFRELLTEWMDRIGMPKSYYGRPALPGAERVGLLKNQRTLVRCDDRNPLDFLAVFLVLSEDVDAVIEASEYDPRRRHSSRYSRYLSQKTLYA